MRKPLIALAFALTIFSVGKPGKTDSNNCQNLTVIAADGYVNIRSEPMVKEGNIVGVLPSGSQIQTQTPSRGWYEIKSPFVGWLAGSQVATVSCHLSETKRVRDRARDILIEVGHPAIQEFGQKAAQGNTNAAETLAKMAPGVDGATAEVYSSAIALWAKSQPCFLIQVLDKQDITTRYRALSALDFGLGSSDSPARQRFESVINKQSANNLTALAWKDITLSN